MKFDFWLKIWFLFVCAIKCYNVFIINKFKMIYWFLYLLHFKSEYKQCTVYHFFVCHVYYNAGNGILVLVDILLFNKGVNTKCFVLFEWAIVVLTPTQQFFNYIMARTS
jgi:hypothetical protein